MKDVTGLIDQAVRDHGGLDVFYANAGISGGLASIFEQSPEDWQEILRVNLIGPFLAIKHAAPVMKERGGGSIICTASVAGLRSGAGGPAYSASKAGVIRLVQVRRRSSPAPTSGSMRSARA
jgi:NAD(P)-dependent dehydrogenase (short-subunit alcohol dehydrogenase family)